MPNEPSISRAGGAGAHDDDRPLPEPWTMPTPSVAHRRIGIEAVHEMPDREDGCLPTVLQQPHSRSDREVPTIALRRRHRPARSVAELRLALLAWRAVVREDAASAVAGDHGLPSRAFAGTLLEMTRQELLRGSRDVDALGKDAIAFARGVAADARRLR